MLRILTIVPLLAMLALPSAGQRSTALDHRDDFRMNSISGGDFRSYITDHVREDDLWARSMRTFGTFHNHMHEMMSDLVRYDAAVMDGGERIPDFEERISGGEWSTYRENIERDGAEPTWRDFVQVTEIMHDRVHHAMYKSVVYDNASRSRNVDLNEYIGEGRAPYSSAEAIPDHGQVRTTSVPRDDFRELVWHSGFEGRYLHAAMQKMLVFDELLYRLMSDWAEYTEMHGENDRIDAWQEFVDVSELMRERIQHMMHVMTVHLES